MIRHLSLVIIILGISYASSHDPHTNDTIHDETNLRSAKDFVLDFLTVETEMESNETLTGTLGQGRELTEGRTFGIRRMQFLMPIVYALGVMSALLVTLTVLSFKSLMIGVILLGIKMGSFLSNLTYPYYSSSSSSSSSSPPSWFPPWWSSSSWSPPSWSSPSWSSSPWSSSPWSHSSSPSWSYPWSSSWSPPWSYPSSYSPWSHSSPHSSPHSSSYSYPHSSSYSSPHLSPHSSSYSSPHSSSYSSPHSSSPHSSSSHSPSGPATVHVHVHNKDNSHSHLDYDNSDHPPIVWDTSPPSSAYDKSSTGSSKPSSFVVKG